MKCVDTIGILSFLNNAKVKEVINTDISVNWKFCNSDLQNKWVRDPEGAVKTYEKLLKSENNLRIVNIFLI